MTLCNPVSGTYGEMFYCDNCNCIDYLPKYGDRLASECGESGEFGSEPSSCTSPTHPRVSEGRRAAHKRCITGISAHNVTSTKKNLIIILKLDWMKSKFTYQS